jgi:uncharacterized protein (TIGR00288 family)
MSEERKTEDRKIALFMDFENLALGIRDAKYKSFDIQLVLERLLEKGKIVVKRSYADWEHYSKYKRPFHEAAMELIDVPKTRYSGKNSADIRLVVDVMDMCYSKGHIDLFVVASGDSDFSPLVSKLKENNKTVIGLGVKNSTSELLMENCDEFIFYEDLVRGPVRAPQIPRDVNDKKAEAFKLLINSIAALMRENKEVLWSSMIKQQMQRKHPSFNEGYYGYQTFSQLLEDAQRSKIVSIERDKKSGTYIVIGFPNGH